MIKSIFIYRVSSLTETETKYSTIEREMIAIMDTITRLSIWKEISSSYCPHAFGLYVEGRSE